MNTKEKVSLGELGKFERISEEETKEIFDKLPVLIFKIQKAMFRVSYINHGKKTFTAELINGQIPEVSILSQGKTIHVSSSASEAK